MQDRVPFIGYIAGEDGGFLFSAQWGLPGLNGRIINTIRDNA